MNIHEHSTTESILFFSMTPAIELNTATDIGYFNVIYAVNKMNIWIVTRDCKGA